MARQSFASNCFIIFSGGAFARREGKTAWDVAQFYGDYFVTALGRLNFLQPTAIPKATEHIEEQIAMIRELEQKGHTYTIDDGVYFDTSTFSQYADFAGLDLDEQQAGARVEFNAQKRNATDFALWKFSPKDLQRDMEWDSPWGMGFPGWHIECSAMSRKYLGNTIDIHSGGIDHIPVHHTNEIAQSQCATGKPFSRFWMHTNHILINDEKISKSLGNGITLEDIVAKGFSLQSFRLHVLESHYRSQSKFSWDSLQAAQNRLACYQALADLRWQTIPGEVSDNYTQLMEQLPKQLTEAVLDDLDTPKVLYLLSQAEPLITKGYRSSARSELETFIRQYVDNLLGLQLLSSVDISEAQKDLIARREAVRTNQDWEASDKLRQELEAQGIGIRDTSSGAIWYRL